MDSKRAAKIERRMKAGTGELSRTSNDPLSLSLPRPPACNSLPASPLLYSLFSLLCLIAVPMTTKMIYPQFKRPTEAN